MFLAWNTYILVIFLILAWIFFDFHDFHNSGVDFNYLFLICMSLIWICMIFMIFTIIKQISKFYWPYPASNRFQK